MKKRFATLGCLTILLCVLALAYLFAPWKDIIEERLKGLAAEKGITGLALKVETVTPTQLYLKDIAMSGPLALQLDHLTLDYTLEEMLKGKLQTLSLKGLALTLPEDEKKSSATTGFAFPLKKEELALLPFSLIKAEDSMLDIEAEKLKAHIPFSAALDGSRAVMELMTTGMAFTSGDKGAETGTGTVSLILEDGKKTWDGLWTIKDITTKGFDPPLPSLAGKGRVTLSAQGLYVTGTIASKDEATRLAFTYAHPRAASEKATLLVKAFAMPWQEGIVRIDNATIPLSGKDDIHLTLLVQKVSLDALMQLLTSKRATATGLVSGSVPVTIKSNGTLIVHNGELRAESPGTISLQEDAIPGDNEQLALVRTILKKLNYLTLSVGLENDKEGKLALAMTLEGQNPDFQQGRPVKLNVHLGGDVLGFLQQNVMLLFDPKKLLQQENDRKR